MTLHVVLGDGYMPTKELTAHLEDMRAKALADDDGFWFLIQAKAEPTDTDRAFVKWMTDPDHDIYFDAIGDKDSADKIYSGAQNIHKATRLAPRIVELMEKARSGAEEAPEDADLLAMFFSDADDAEEDRWLNDVISAVTDAGFKAFAFNDGMTQITEVGEEGDGEEEPAALPMYSREQLESMELDDLKKIALDKGITVPPRSRKPTYVDAILDEEEEVPEVEIEAQPVLRMVPNPNGATTTTASTSGTATFLAPPELSGPAMIIVIYNGTVTSRVVTAEQAQELLSNS